MNVLNAAELQGGKWLKGKILRYVYFVAINTFQNKSFLSELRRKKWGGVSTGLGDLRAEAKPAGVSVAESE